MKMISIVFLCLLALGALSGCANNEPGIQDNTGAHAPGQGTDPANSGL